MSDRSGYDQLRDLFRGRPGAGDIGAGQDPAEIAKRETQEPAIPHAGEDGALLPAGAGYVSPQIAPGTPYSPELNTAPTTPKVDRYPRVPHLWDYKRVTVGAVGISGVMDQVGFPVASVRIDNWSTLYVLVRGPNIYIPPSTIGAIVKTFNNPQSVEVISEAPPGLNQGAITAGQVVDLWCFEDELTPSPGQSLASGGGGGGGPVTITNTPAMTADGVANGNVLEFGLGGYNGATIDRLRTVPAAKDTAGAGVLASGLLGYDGANYRVIRVATGEGSFTPGAAGSPLAVSLFRADGQDFSAAINGWANQDNYSPNLSLPAAALMYAYGASGTASGYALRTPSVFKSATVSAAGNTAIWTPTSGKKFRLMRYRYEASNAAVLAAQGDETIGLQDGTTDLGLTSDTRLATVATVGMAISTPWIDLGNGILSSAANNVLNVNLGTALAGGVVRVFVCGTEE